MLKKVSSKDVRIDSGFWEERQKINSETSIYAIWEQFKVNRRFEALKLNTWSESDGEKPHIFWDSDVAKWIESVAFILQHKNDGNLENAADEYIDLMCKNQEESGYFNSYFMVFEPENKWSRRTDHELYCAGHLIEAAVVYFTATGKDKFLKFAKKFADHIEKVFVYDKLAKFCTPGHPEIELALVKLYEVTGERRYLSLGKYFIDTRGTIDTDYYDWANRLYSQDHLPVREQTTAEGHSVRATYLYSAMADYAAFYNDEELLSACKQIFDDIISKKIYITGGIGSSYLGEAFTIPYDLPNLTSYAESCASIGLIFFAGRLFLHDSKSVYADVIEHVLYNGVLANISLDGKAFYYENAMEIDPNLINRDVSSDSVKTRYPLVERQEYFGCSCCPPNNTRLFADIGGYIYTTDNDTLFVNQYMGNSAEIDLNGTKVEINQETEYPLDGEVEIKTKGFVNKKIAVRVPKWCQKYSISLNGETLSDFDVKDGYAYINIQSAEACIKLSLAMDVFLVEASPNVQEDSGRVALLRGPIVYCLEGIDNGDDLRDVIVCENLCGCTVEFDDLLKTNVIIVDGLRRDIKTFNSLYERLNNKRFVRQKLRFIPYNCHANRGVTEMVVWVLHK